MRWLNAIAALALLSVPALAQGELIVEKKVFELPSYITAGGATIKGVRVGWESYGTLNADRSNAVLITNFFSATSHAAGKYAPGDKAPGYWDAIIGPGKAIDTNKFFVLSSDTLVNLNANTPNVVTTGPASVNPDTGKPFGPSFPVVTMRDFVNVQKALLESLGITKVKAVVGASMGALQAYEWAAAYPDMVERIVPVIRAAGGDPFLVACLDVWAQPIRLDPKWRNGDYHGGEPPLDGLKAALKIVTLHANGVEWAEKTFGSAPAEVGKDPAASMANRFKIGGDPRPGRRRPRVGLGRQPLPLPRQGESARRCRPGENQDPGAGDLRPDRPRLPGSIVGAHGRGATRGRRAGRDGDAARPERASERGAPHRPGWTKDCRVPGEVAHPPSPLNGERQIAMAARGVPVDRKRLSKLRR
jgi:homoserine O-acetyltransferase/O-succinyltransferase